jgi:hypothetical protein
MLATLLFAASGSAASDAEHFPAEPSAAEASALRSLIASGTTLAQNAQHCVTQPELMANYSWMGQLVHYSVDGCASLCAGALVAPGTFLTAAHCLFKDDRVTPQFGSVLDPSGYKVVLGTIGPMRSHAARAVRRAEQCTLGGMVGAGATFPIPGCTKGAEGWRVDFAPAAAGPNVSVLEVGAVFARNGLASHGVEMPNDWAGNGYGDVGVVMLRASACNATTNGTAFGRGAHAALRLNAGELLDAPDQWPRTFGWGNVGGAAPGDAAIGTSPFLKSGDMRLRAQGTLSGQCTAPNLALGLAAMPGTLCGCRSGAAQKSCLTSASADWRVQHGSGYTTPGLGDSGGPWVSNGSFHIGLYSGGSAVANIQQFTRTFRYRCWIRDLINAFDPCVNLNRTAARRCEAVDRRFSQTVGLTETLVPTVPNGPKTCAPSFVGVPSAGAPGALAMSREVCANGTEYHAPTPSPTPFPTNFPTPAPTPSGTPKWELQVDDAGMIRSLKRPACEPPLCAQRIEGLELVTGGPVPLDDSFLALAADESGAGSLLDRPTRVVPHPRARPGGKSGDDPRFGFGGGFDGWSLQYDRVLVPAIFSDGHGSVVPGGVSQADAAAAHTAKPNPSLMDLKVQYNVTVREIGEGLDARPCLCQSLSLQLELPDHAADLLLLHPRSATQFNVPLQWFAHLAHSPRVMPPHFSPRADGPLGAWDLFNVGNLTHPTGEPSDVWCENWTNTTSRVVCHLNPRADTSMCPFNYGLLV